MNLANRITVFRILLIPVFIGLALAYGRSAAAGRADEFLRYAAAGVFLLCAVGDGVDGWVARRLKQETWLGRLLDPIADKGLMLSAIITLSLTGWSRDHRFPLWFPVLAVTRDVLCVAAAFLIRHLTGSVRIVPHWTGKVTTVTQFVAIGWVMLHFSAFTQIPDIVPVFIAAAFTVMSGMVYLVDCIGQIRRGRSAHLLRKKSGVTDGA